MNGDYKGGDILDVQMYDTTNKATFGFGMIHLICSIIFRSFLTLDRFCGYIQ